MSSIRSPELVASPGTYDHGEACFTHIGNIVQCVAYGPGNWNKLTSPMNGVRWNP